MPDILTSTDFTAVFTAASRATTEEISWALDGGKDELADLVGDEAITDAESDTPEDVPRQKRLKRALGHFAYANLVINVSSRLHESGVLKKRQDEIAEGTTNEYLLPKDVEMLAAQHRKLATTAVQKYLVTDEPNDEYAPSVEFNHHETTETVC